MTITFDKGTAKFILDTLGGGYCAVCSRKLTLDNFAGAYQKELYCNNFICLLILNDKIRVRK